MASNLQSIFANLAERERVLGHHSAEGRGIRTLGRALNGWSMGDLSGPDVMVLSGQAMEDWLKARLKISQWSPKSLSDMIPKALEAQLVTEPEVAQLQRVHKQRMELDQARLAAAEIEAALTDCLQIIDKHWS